MANNKIQIKRSTANATVTGLSNGELAYTQNGNVLYIGAPDGSAAIRIGGQQVPGTLTANQALVANSASGIDQVKVGNLAFTGTTQTMQANGDTGTSGFVLFSGGASSNLYWATAGAVGVNTAAQYTWSNTTIFTNTVSFGTVINVATGAVIANAIGVFTTGTVNALSHTVGANLIINTTSISYVGNSTTSPTITLANTGAFSIGSGTTTQTTSVISVGNSAGFANMSPAGFFGNGINITSVNATSITNGTLPDARLSAAVVNTSGSFTLAGNNTFGGTNTVFTSNVSMSGANVNITGTNTNITANQNFGGTTSAFNSNVTFSGANVNIGGTNTNITSNANFGGTNTNISSNVTLTGSTVTGLTTDLSMRNGVFSGNLTVSGTVITVNTSQLVVNDNLIELGSGNTSADLVDSGFFSPAGNSISIWYSGIARIASSSNSSLSYYRVFVSNTNPNTSATIDTTSNTKTGMIQSYLAPYGLTGIFVVNATNISISGNSSLPLALAANTLSLSTALPGTSGGTGLSTIANNTLIFGNSTNGFNTLALNTTVGYVLQTNGTAIVYDVLDGGTF